MARNRLNNKRIEKRLKRLEKEVASVYSVPSKGLQKKWDKWAKETAPKIAEAQKQYNPAEGASFKTFLDRTLEHEIPKFVDGANAKVVVNPRVNIRKMKVKKMEREFRSKHGVDPTVEQLAEICGFSVKQVREALYAYDVSTNMLSLNNTGDDSDGEYLDSFQSEITGFEAIERAYTREIVANAIEEALTSTERLAVKIMFGFFDGKEHTNQEVADIMDLNSRQHANQIIGRALKKLRDAVDNPRAA